MCYWQTNVQPAFNVLARRWLKPLRFFIGYWILKHGLHFHAAFFFAEPMRTGFMKNWITVNGRNISRKPSKENDLINAPIVSGNDFTLDVANPKQPKILCLASNPQKANIYGAVMSLYLTAIKRVAIEQEQQPLSMVLEEFPSIYFSGIDRFLAVLQIVFNCSHHGGAGY
jgi:hypothetical protein